MSHYSEREYTSYITSSFPPDQVVPQGVDGLGKIKEGEELARWSWMLLFGQKKLML